MAGNRSASLGRGAPSRARAALRNPPKSIDTLQRQVSQIGIRLADLLVKVAAGLEAGLQETRGHLKVAVDTMMEQAEELEQIKAWIEAACLTPASLASSPRGGKDAAEVARVAEKLSETETRLAALESEAMSHQLRDRARRVETPDRLWDERRWSAWAHLFSPRRLAGWRATARRASGRSSKWPKRSSSGSSRAPYFRRQLSGDVTTDGCRALKSGREACEELRREACRPGTSGDEARR